MEKYILSLLNGHIPTRPMDRFLIERYGKKGLMGVEIGVLRGEHALTLLKRLHVKRLYLVDPYACYGKYPRKPFKQKYIDDARKAAYKKFSKDARVNLVYEFSKEAASKIPDNLDFVYIDGNHTYEYVRDDIENYYPKVKHGGVLGGHDFSGRWPGVQRAVVEFIQGKNWYLDYPDWWVVKE